MKKVQVLIVDDSAVIRNILRSGLARDPRLEVIGTAKDAYQARDVIVKKKPDIITLDLGMPRMNGLEFIQVLMEHWPLPIIVISSIADSSREASLKALELGAVDIFPKPKPEDSSNRNKVMAQLADLLFYSARAKVKGGKARAVASVAQQVAVAPAPGLAPLRGVIASEKVIVIGASTGGTEAIRKVLENMPAGAPGIVMVQHMPEGFTQSFADRLNQICPNLMVREARNGDTVESGVALLAPGNQHMLLRKHGSRYFVEVKGGPPVNRHRPSVDVIFHSAAECAGKNAIGVILTGMGADGALGLLAMKEAGGRTIAQDEESCVVYGMPREAVENGSVEKILPIQQITQGVLRFL
ncbi:MAG: chemotaxis response regulator protein-glutamate methylesterase [SAR324 cluster bacterium]|uniref:Protein-glutamate methylesterase/protein-glutamine glutaminase n=1 Tax=SAR324 cluster bacterium TaxID=2024889 RepID=A0A2A4TC73_9DELT|nr:MAG: chemotaxis response regulator protein-glutamate methylesterase [SAR324 cluster bacterium]